PIGEEFAAAIDRKRRVKPDLPGFGKPIGPFGRAVETMVGYEPAGKFRLGAPAKRVIEMLLKGPLPDLGDLGVVDLDFVRRQSCARLNQEGRDGCKQESAEKLRVHGDRARCRSRVQGPTIARTAYEAIFAWKGRHGCG